MIYVGFPTFDSVEVVENLAGLASYPVLSSPNGSMWVVDALPRLWVCNAKMDLAKGGWK